jgi:energy-coupling factor transport system substrate-specific component
MTSTMSSSIRNLGFTSWRTIDLVTTAMLGVAFGVAYWGWSFAYEGIYPAFNAYLPASGVLGGPWLIAGVVAGLVIRKPGAALLAELIAANVEYLIGNEWGASTMVSGLLQGLGVEVVLAVFLYRRFGVVIAALGGIVAAVVESVYEWSAYFDYWDRAEQLAYMGCFAASGAIVAGVGGWLLVRALAETGALDAFASGRDYREERAV